MAGRPKKKEESNPEEKSAFQLALDKLNKKYGVGTVLTLEDKSTDGYDVISSGSIGIDYSVLGVGGWVKGKLYELIGWEGSGKSTLCGHAVAECQKTGGKALYVDGEHAVDKKYFNALGVDTSKMLLSQPSSGEEGFNVALEMIQTGELDLVIIDSDSSLMPLSVVEGEIGDSAIGKKARLNGSAYPKLKVALSTHKTCVIVISQYREKIGMMFGDPRTTQGGHALKFYTDVRLEVSKTLKKEGDVNSANITKLKCIKNKMSPPFRQHSVDVLYGVGMDKTQELLDLLHDYEIGVIRGKSINVDEDKYLLTDFISLLEDNPEYKEALKERIIKKIKDLPVEIEEETEIEIHNQNQTEKK